jgi:hypothetical protein
MHGRWVLSLLGLLGLAAVMILVVFVNSTELRRTLWPLWLVWAIVSLSVGLSMARVLRALDVDDLSVFRLAERIGIVLAAINMVLCLVGLFMSTSV